jgi:hypothetical protein
MIHTVNTNYKMRTTKALLCAAIVAAGAITAVAQNVYSLNVVGYVNVPVPAGYSILANPLSAGVTNGANEVMTPIDGSVFLLWNGAGYSYIGYDLGNGGWVDANSAAANPPALPPGKGFFFYNPGAATTLTFVGQVVPSPGVTNSMTLPSGYSLVSTPMPVSGTLGTAATTGAAVVPGAVNMPIMDGEVMLSWNGAGYTYQGFDLGNGGWVDANSAAIPAPTITAGKGFFFYNPGAAAPWLQALP